MAPLNLIVAVCEGWGIGKGGTLPWRLKKEMGYFARMTKHTQDNSKQNAVIMGRKTWESIPERFRPLGGRLNVVLSRQDSFVAPDGVMVCHSLKDALSKLAQEPQLETYWIIGGSSLYDEVITADPSLCHRIYLTQIHKRFDCDTFFREANLDKFCEVEDDRVPQETQSEGDITFTYKVYQSKS